MLRLNNIIFSEDGKRIDYSYSLSENTTDYFNESQPFFVEFDSVVSQVPESIAVIPLLSNVMPIAWFSGFDVFVEELDEDFNNSLIKVKNEFIKNFPTKNISGNLHVNRIVKNKLEKAGDKSVMLFSGGVDSYSTFIRTYEKNPDLITYQGADIPLSDDKQWQDFVQYTENEGILKTSKKYYVKSNLRDFYTYKVELLIDDLGWWGIVQHGLSLIGSLAPIAFKNNYSKLYIASTFKKEIEVFRGSTPNVDENISWAGLEVCHEGSDMSRQDKVNLIVEFARKHQIQLPIRVCYSELRKGFNCSNCEKCFRTILALMVNNENPNDYGFDVDESIYDKLIAYFNQNKISIYIKYYYDEILEEVEKGNKIFKFSNSSNEREKMKLISERKIEDFMDIDKSNLNKKLSRIRFIIRNKFPSMVNLYRKIKH